MEHRNVSYMRSNDKVGRPQCKQQDRETQPKAYNRPELDNRQDKTQLDDRRNVSQFNNRQARPQFDNRQSRPQYNNRQDRPQFDNRQDRSQYNNRQDRPQYNNRQDRPQYNNRQDRPQFDNRQDRPQFDNRQDRPQYDNRHDRQTFGNRRDAPQYDNRRVRPQYDSRQADPNFNNRQDRRNYNNRQDRSNYNNRQDRPQFNNIQDRSQFDNRHDKPQYDNSVDVPINVQPVEVLATNCRPDRKFHGSTDADPELEAKFFSNAPVRVNLGEYDSIPVKVEGNYPPEPILDFTEKWFPPEIMNNLNRLNYLNPTPIQRYTIPAGLQHRDVLASAQTGSGKTAGYILPIAINMLKEGPCPDLDQLPLGGIVPTTLILVPTRELAEQVSQEGMKFCYQTGIKICVAYGGTDFNSQFQAISQGCDILVATPGRLIDFLRRKILALCGIKYLVLDEADRMLDMGFLPQIKSILYHFDMSRDHTTCMFSATFPSGVISLTRSFLKKFLKITVGRVGSVANQIKQTFYYIKEEEKFQYLNDILHMIDYGRMLVFVETKKEADDLTEILCSKGFVSESIHGNKSQEDRTAALESFKLFKTPILVATDVAARGLDIPEVNCVINYDLPSNIGDYVHRIGRTGRAGNKGISISFYTDLNSQLVPRLIQILDENDQEIPEFFQLSRSYMNAPSCNYTSESSYYQKNCSYYSMSSYPTEEEGIPHHDNNAKSNSVNTDKFSDFKGVTKLKNRNNFDVDTLINKIDSNFSLNSKNNTDISLPVSTNNTDINCCVSTNNTNITITCPDQETSKPSTCSTNSPRDAW